MFASSNLAVQNFYNIFLLLIFIFRILFLDTVTIGLSRTIVIAAARITSFQTSCRDVGFLVLFWRIFVPSFLFFSCFCLFAELGLKLEACCRKFSFYEYMMGCCRHPARLYKIIDCPIFRIWGPERKRGLKRETSCVSSPERASVACDKKKGRGKIIIKTKELYSKRKQDWKNGRNG